MKIITFEGIEGVGKSTQITLLKDYLISKKYSVDVLREPGGTLVGEEIRAILLSSKEEMNPVTELLLMFASRSQLIKEKIQNNECDFILIDRFYHASISYQSFGRGLPIGYVEELIKITGCPIPDLTYILDLDIEIAFERKKDDKKDRIENSGNEFFKRVREGYLDIQSNNQDRVKLINADNSISSIHEKILEYLKEIL